MKNLDLKPLFILLPAALGMALLAGCPAKNNPSSPQNQSAPANTPTNVITSTPTMTSTPCMVAGTPCTSSPTATPTNTATITPTPTVTNTQTATSTPTNSLSAFVTVGSSAFFNNPAGIAYSNGNLWVMDYTNFNLQEWATSGSAPVTTVSSFATTAFSMPWAVGVDPMTGNVYVADGNYGNLANMQSEVFDPSGNFLYAFGNTELGGSTNSDPTGVGVNAAGTTVYIAGESRDTVYVYSISGTSPNQTYTYQFAFGASGIAPQVINNPYNIHVDGSDNVWVACYGDSSIKEYSAAGIFENNFTAPELVNVQDVVAANGKVYGLNGSGLVVIFNSTGSVIGQFGAGTLNSPQGITTDGAGNFYVTDSANQCVFGFH